VNRSMVSFLGSALLATSLSAIPAPAQSPALHVLSASPQGRPEGRKGIDRIQIVFSAPVVPLAAPDPGAAPPDWLEISPPILARWRWAGTATLIGEPRQGLPRATQYRLRIAKGLRTIGGAVLEEDYSFSFVTQAPEPAVAGEIGQGYDDIFKWIDYWKEGVANSWLNPGLEDRAPVLLVWNQPVDDGSLVGRVKVRSSPRPVGGAGDVLTPEAIASLERSDRPAYAAWTRFLEAARGAAEAEVPFDLEPDAAFPHQAFRIRPRGLWPAAARIVVEVASGVRSLEGPEPGAARTSAGFSTPWPFAPLHFKGRRAGTEGIDPERAALTFTVPVRWKDLAGFMRYRPAGETKWRTVKSEEDSWYWSDSASELTLEPLRLEAGRRYEICLDAGAPDADGEMLGFPWCGGLRTGHRTPHFNLVQGDGVLERDGPRRLPLASTNVLTYRFTHTRVEEEQLAQFLAPRRGSGGGPEPLPAGAETAKIAAPADSRVVSPLELDPILAGKPGIVWSRVEPGELLPDSMYDPDEIRALRAPRSAITQVTGLGLTVKSTWHEGLLVWVTRLKDGRPAEGAIVRARDASNRILWEGTTDASGLARTPPGIGAAKPWYSEEADAAAAGAEGMKRALFVTARMGEDLAYAKTSWYEGHRGWEFNLPVDWSEEKPVAGIVWADRGAVRPGESVHVKAVLRRRANRELRLLDGSAVVFVVRDSRGNDVLVRRTTLDAWGAAELEVEIPPGAPLGNWDVILAPEYDEQKKTLGRSASWWRAQGGFMVAQFRRPRFRVGVTTPRASLIAGDPLECELEGSYLSGGPMAGARVVWSVQAEKEGWQPNGKRWEGFEFNPAGFEEDADEDGPERRRPAAPPVAKGEGALDARGRLAVKVPRVEAGGKWPTRLTVEAEVTDIDRQRSAARESVLVLPGEFAIGVKRPGYFLDAAGGVDTAVVTVTPDGEPVTGVPVKVSLIRRHWESVRRRDAGGRYEFESRPVDETVAETEVVSAAQPAPVHLDAKEGGYYAVVASASDARGNAVGSSATLYMFGQGYSAWRFDRGNRIELIPERGSYAPGETARILVKSPWESALALVTVERSGILETRVETLAGTMPVLEVPVTRDYAPNVFVSVVVLRGRIDARPDPELADPGRPAYRIGYCELTVPPRERRLAVKVSPERGEYRPGGTASIAVAIAGADAAPRRASVTLWAVDAGVLQLTGYRTPDPMAVFFERQGLGVTTSESRTRLVGRRSYGTKGAKRGGGGGVLDGGDQIRTDFRALAVWKGDVVTGDDGAASISFVLPDSLTTYRVMAVAIAGAEEFGSGDAELRVTKPIGLEPALPRFLRPDDAAQAGVVVRNRTGSDRQVEVRASVMGDAGSAREEAGSGVARINGPGRRTVLVPAGQSLEVRFGFAGLAPGTARVRFEAWTEDSPAGAPGAVAGPATRHDALEVPLPVIAAAPRETVATFFSTARKAEETIVVPRDVFPSTGGLEVTLAPTALIGAARGATFLDGYPHRCAEQISSRLLGILAAQRIGTGFAPREVDGVETGAWAAATVRTLASYQRSSGGFAFWAEGRGGENAVLTAHVVWSLAAAREAGVPVDPGMMDRGGEYLSHVLRSQFMPWGERDGWTVKVLASFALQRIGKAEPSYYQWLHENREGRPVWGRAILAATMLAADRADPRAAPLLQEVRNALTVEARNARLNEDEPGWGWWFWWSEPRSSAMALLALLAADPNDPVNERLASGLVDHLARDRWLDTQNAAWMLQSLAAYATLREGSSGRFEAVASLGKSPLLKGLFEDRSSPPVSVKVGMADLLKRAGDSAKGALPLTVRVEGSGMAHAAVLLSYASRGGGTGSAQGMSLERRFLDAEGRAAGGVPAGGEVTLEVAISSTTDGRFVAIEAPLPAGLEAIDPNLATTARAPAQAEGERTEDRGEDYGDEAFSFWELPGIDHIEMRDDRIVLYATWLPAGTHRTKVRCRATTPGMFVLAPAHAERMYAPEIFATTAGGSFEVFAPRRE
jgi:uncharacterized protein YfaS (alpha-2-macroglobulin family)